MMRCLHLLIIFIISIEPGYAQYRKISGIINSYSKIVSISENKQASLVEVADPGLFAKGDKILIIQMKGAEVDTADTENFGSILDLKSAGNYEFTRIKGIVGSIMILEKQLEIKYDPAGKVQAVKVPEYQSCIVTDVLTAKPWDGETGGVLSLHVDKTIFLEADIDVSGRGFRGGNVSNNPDGFCNFSSLSFYYPLVNQDTLWQEGGAMKGEGIAELPSELMAGKGALANGGGGGNKHNAGGGGGANFTAGGKGGNEIGLCDVFGNGGFGGYGLTYSPNRIFLGGGGGCGDYNDEAGTPGASGGGIVLVSAQYIEGKGHFIKANGSSQSRNVRALGDGAGGGGAGGSVFLDIEQFGKDSLFVEALGGNGGSISENALVSSFGPGGGGGSGIIVYSHEEMPPHILTVMGSGECGLVLNRDNPAFETGNGATAGMATDINFITMDARQEDSMEMVTVDYREILNGSTMVLDKVQFMQGKHHLTSEAEGALEGLASFLKSNPGIQIELSGHTDDVGDPAINLKLSEKRVEEVKKSLVKKGVSESIIATKAFGGTKPVSSNRYSTTRLLNRRVELKIIQ